MQKIIKVSTCFLLALGFGVSSFAQSSTVSPFSRLGLGDFEDPNLYSVSLSGGLIGAFHDPYKTNIQNPASLGFLEATAFEFGVYGQLGRLSDNNESDNVRNGNIGYLSLAFPLLNPLNEIIENKKHKIKWGAQIALLPYTSVGYDILASASNAEVDTVFNNIQGSGNTYKLLMNHGVRFKNTSFGASLGFLFGSISSSNRITLPTVFESEPAVINSDYSVSGFLWNLGIQHDFHLNSNEDTRRRPYDLIPRLTIGMTFHSNTSFDTRADLLTSNGFTTGGIIDTVFSQSNIDGNGTLPLELSVGLMYNSGSKWAYGVNYTYGRWSQYKNDAQETISGTGVLEDLRNSYEISSGGWYIPNRNSIRNLFARSKYTGGIFYKKDPRVLSNDQLTKYGFRIGVEMPFLKPRNFSFLNLGVELGRLSVDQGLQNNYLKINLGLSLNSNQWFLKRKYN